MSIHEALNVFRRTLHQIRSHSFPSRPVSPSSAVVVRIMLPAFVISTLRRATSTPAATKALMALVTSACRNVEGARAIGSRQIVQAVAERAERGLVEAPSHGARADLDRRRVCAQRHHRPAPQQPDQPCLVIASQPPVARARLLRRPVEAEQVARCPAQHLGLLAPTGEEAAAVLDGALPVGNLDVLGAAALQLLECATKAI